jgi:hypothetical protein
VAQVPSTTDKNLVTRGFAEMTDGTASLVDALLDLVSLMQRSLKFVSR